MLYNSPIYSQILNSRHTMKNVFSNIRDMHIIQCNNKNNKIIIEIIKRQYSCEIESRFVIQLNHNLPSAVQIRNHVLYYCKP